MRTDNDIEVPKGFSIVTEGGNAMLRYDADDAYIGTIPVFELTQEWVNERAADLITKRNMAQQAAGVR